MAGLLLFTLDASLKGYAVNYSKMIIQVEVLKKMTADSFGSL